jgi:hypothetical protein
VNVFLPLDFVFLDLKSSRVPTHAIVDCVCIREQLECV